MWRYLKSREFWLTITGFALFFVTFYLLFFFVFLPSYTLHGESVIVPEVTEMSFEDAVAKIEELGLDYEVADSSFVLGKKPLSILAQDPIGVTKVKPGRKVYLTVNRVKAPMVRVPKITGMSQYQSKLRLEGAGLGISGLEFRPYDYENFVFDAKYKGKTLKEGDSLPKYSKVVLFVGIGKNGGKAPVPDLKGHDFQAAISMIHRAGFNVGLLEFDPKSSEPKGMVIRQHPVFYQEDSLYLGTQIDIWVAGPQPEEALEDMVTDSRDSTELLREQGLLKQDDDSGDQEE